MKTLLSTFFGLFMILSTSAQVGVNNPTPEQALDVNGKVKITNDDTAPTAGTMRYNENGKAFEGYNGTDWNSFTSKSNGPLPSNAIPVFSYTRSISGSSEIIFRDWNETEYSSIPPGKMIIVTGIYPGILTSSPEYNYRFQFAVMLGDDLISDAILYLNGNENDTNPLVGDLSPLMVIKPGQNLIGISMYSSDRNIHLSMRGFLVDDLNY